MNQLAMTGDDWRSDREVKNEARAKATLKKTSIVCADKLEAAIDAVRAQMQAHYAVHGGIKNIGIDGRQRLIEDMAEFASFLQGVYDK